MTVAHVLAFLLSTFLSGPTSQASTRPVRATTQAAPVVGLDALYCEEPVYDFGEAWSGDVIEHSFQVTNNSNDTILLEPISTCTCTSTEKNYEIGPHQTIPIKVQFNTRGRVGNVQNSITFRVVGSPKP